MSLISTARALDDQHLLWLVKAAALNHAVANVVAYKQNSTKVNEYNYALYVLMYPHTVDPSLMAFVASESAVSEAVTVSETGEVNSSAVTDAMVTSAVNGAWSKVATKYPNDPQASTPIVGQRPVPPGLE